MFEVKKTLPFNYSLRHSGMRVTSIFLDHLLEQDISEMVETLDALFAGEPAQEDR